MRNLNSYLDEVGPYQFLVLSLLLMPSMLGSVLLLSLTFTAAVPPNRCCNPAFEDCENSTFLIEEYSNESLRNTWLFKSSDTGSSYCHYCTGTGNGSCNKENARPCDNGRIFDTSTTFTSMSIDFGMYCENIWKLDTLRTIFLVGVFIGKTFCGVLADKFGRRPVFLGFLFLQIPVSGAAALSPNYAAFGVSLFITGAAQSITYTIGFVLLMEVVQGGWRTVSGVSNGLFYTLSYFYIALFAYSLPNYRTCLLAMTLPTLLYIPSYWLFPESLSWALLNGKTKTAKKSLQFAAKLNGFEIKSSDLLYLDSSAGKSIRNSDDSKLIELFRYYKLARSYIILWVNWFACGAVYFGLSLNTGDLPGDAYVNFVLSGIVELPGLLLSIPMIEFLGRKPSLIILQGVSGVCLLATGFLPRKDFQTLIVVLATSGKLAISGAFAVIFQLTSESYPTNLRSTGSCLSSLFARFGALLGPQIHLLRNGGIPLVQSHYAGEWLAMTIYGSLALLAALLDFFLHETKGLPLPDTISDAVQMSFHSWRSCSPPSGKSNESDDEREDSEMIRKDSHKAQNKNV